MTRLRGYCSTCGGPLWRRNLFKDLACTLCFLESLAGSRPLFTWSNTREEWRGREDEANAWDGTRFTLEERAGAEQVMRWMSRHDGPVREEWRDYVPIIRNDYDPVTGEPPREVYLSERRVHRFRGVRSPVRPRGEMIEVEP